MGVPARSKSSPFARLEVENDDVLAVPANIAQQRQREGDVAPVVVFVVEPGHHEPAPVVWAVGHFDESDESVDTPEVLLVCLLHSFEGLDRPIALRGTLAE